MNLLEHCTQPFKLRTMKISRNIIFLLLLLIKIDGFGQSIKNESVLYDIQKRADIISTFNNNSLDQFYLGTGGARHKITKYLHSANGFSIHYYHYHSKKIDKGCNFLIGLIKEPFLSQLEEFEEKYKLILGNKYDSILKRINNNENYFIFKKGKINSLILCSPTEEEFAKLLERIFNPIFIANSLDSDNDHLPDYFEKALKTDLKSVDTDNDGLSDYDEFFKYHSNPLETDSDSDGVIDSDWNERREYTYTIKVKREIYSPFNSNEMTDFYQDTRVIYESRDTLIYETLLFPDAVSFIIPTTEQIRLDDTFEKYINPSFFCNYTMEMKNELENLVQEWEFENKYELIQLFAKYGELISNYYPSGEPLQFFIEVNDKTINIIHRERFDDLKTQHFTTDERVLNHLAFGSEMYKNRMHGSCSSTAIYFNTLFRAIGIPTRIISSNPIINYQDTTQIKMLRNLHNNSYRRLTESKIGSLKGKYANHFFYEIFLNGRWIRCDNDEVNVACSLGQGLSIVQDRFNDFSEKNFAQTWGKRMVEDKGNSYKTLELSDQLPIYK